MDVVVDVTATDTAGVVTAVDTVVAIDTGALCRIAPGEADTWEFC